MKLRLGAAVILAAALTPLSVVTTTSSPAAAGVDITPPEVGSCHDLTFDEAYEPSDPDPAVACSERHTTVTVGVIALNDPDWTDKDAIAAKVGPKCVRAELAFFSGKAKELQMSTYSTWLFFPTRVQQEAGAAWVRCDTALYGYRSLKPLPTSGEPRLGRLPHPDGIAQCRKGKSDGYAVASCDKAHRFRATHAFKYPGDRYPGVKKVVKWTKGKCGRALRSAFFYDAPTKRDWSTGHRYSICSKPTRR